MKSAVCIQIAWALIARSRDIDRSWFSMVLVIMCAKLGPAAMQTAMSRAASSRSAAGTMRFPPPLMGRLLRRLSSGRYTAVRPHGPGR